MNTELNWNDSLVTRTGYTSGELMALAFNCALDQVRAFMKAAEDRGNNEESLQYFKMVCAYEYLLNQAERLAEKERN